MYDDEVMILDEKVNYIDTAENLWKVIAMTIEEILSKEENQTFDRKSINISPKDLAIPIVAFANADGGDIAIGITDKNRRIEGIDFETKKLNELLRVPFDFCNPTIKVGIEKVPCVDEKGRKNPQNFFPRARIRFIRYEGTEEKFGTEMNVIKDVIFEGTLLI